MRRRPARQSCDTAGRIRPSGPRSRLTEHRSGALRPVNEARLRSRSSAAAVGNRRGTGNPPYAAQCLLLGKSARPPHRRTGGFFFRTADRSETVDRRTDALFPMRGARCPAYGTGSAGLLFDTRHPTPQARCAESDTGCIAASRTRRQAGFRRQRQLSRRKTDTQHRSAARHRVHDGKSIRSATTAVPPKSDARHQSTARHRAHDGKSDSGGNDSCPAEKPMPDTGLRHGIAYTTANRIPSATTTVPPKSDARHRSAARHHVHDGRPDSVVRPNEPAIHCRDRSAGPAEIRSTHLKTIRYAYPHVPAAHEPARQRILSDENAPDSSLAALRRNMQRLRPTAGRRCQPSGPRRPGGRQRRAVRRNRP